VTGEPPFNEITREPAVILALGQGKRPKRPSVLSVESAQAEGFWHILEKCWKQEPGDRPSATEVQAMVSLNNSQFCRSIPINEGSL
jgi:hypothetical protein